MGFSLLLLQLLRLLEWMSLTNATTALLMVVCPLSEEAIQRYRILSIFASTHTSPTWMN